MNVIRGPRFVRVLTLTTLALAGFGLNTATAQQPAAPPPTPVARLTIEPASLTLVAGQTGTVKLTAYDAQGNVITNPNIRASGPRSALQIGAGEIRGLMAGDYEVVITAVTSSTAEPVMVRLPVKVTWPALGRVEIAPEPGRLYTGVTLAHRARAFHTDSTERPAGTITWRWRSSNDAVASVDRYGNVTAHRAGPVTITAQAEGANATIRHTVAVNPVTSLTLDLKETSIKTGDVVHLAATARRANGSTVADVPITWSYTYVPDDSIAAPGATGVIDR